MPVDLDTTRQQIPGQWTFWDIPHNKVDTIANAPTATQSPEDRKDNDSLKMQDAVTDWIKSGISADKMKKLQDLMNDDSTPSDADMPFLPLPKKLAVQLPEPKKMEEPSTGDEWADWSASPNLKVKKKKEERQRAEKLGSIDPSAKSMDAAWGTFAPSGLKYNSDARPIKDFEALDLYDAQSKERAKKIGLKRPNDELFPTSHGGFKSMIKEQEAKARNGTLDILPVATMDGPKSTLFASADTSKTTAHHQVMPWPEVDSWDSWGIPAKKKAKKPTIKVPFDLLAETPSASNSNPWAKPAVKISPALREPEAILDEFNSSLWGASKKKQPRFPVRHSHPSATKLHSWESEVLAAELSRKASEVSLKQDGAPSELPAVKPTPNLYDWSQWANTSTAKSKKPIPVVLPEPETSYTIYNEDPYMKAKNPFESEARTTESPEAVSKPARNVSWGTFATKQSEEVNGTPKAVKEPKVSPWPYLEPESRFPAVPSTSQQSLLDELAEWGSFTTKDKKTKKPVAFDFLDEPAAPAPDTTSVSKDVASESVLYDPFGWGRVSAGKVAPKRRTPATITTSKTATVDPVGDDKVPAWTPNGEPGFGIFVIKNKSHLASVSSLDLHWEMFAQNNNAKRDSSVSEMSGDNQKATAPVCAEAQVEYRKNVLGLDEIGKPKYSVASIPPYQPNGSKVLKHRIQEDEEDIPPTPPPHRYFVPSVRVYVFNITYKHAFSTDTLRHTLKVSFTTKAAITAEIEKFITPYEPFGQIYTRKIDILSANGQEGDVDLSALDDMSWPDILGFLEESTKIITIAVVVTDT